MTNHEVEIVKHNLRQLSIAINDLSSGLDELSLAIGVDQKDEALAQVGELRVALSVLAEACTDASEK